MGWIVAITGLGFLVYLKFIDVDKHTFRNLLRYGTMLAIVVVLVIIWVLVSTGR